MSNAALILSSLGGVATFITAVIVVARGIFKNITATKDNTVALERLSTKIDKVSDIQTEQAAQIAVLNDRIKR